LAHLCGSLDEHLRSIESALGVSISRRNEFFRVEGAKDKAEVAMQLLQSLHETADAPFSAEQVQLALVELMAHRGRREPSDLGVSSTTAPAAATAAARVAGAPHDLVLRTRRADTENESEQDHRADQRIAEEPVQPFPPLRTNPACLSSALHVRLPVIPCPIGMGMG
jgi:phosphate starvation-inducible PhoH-like protein